MGPVVAAKDLSHFFGDGESRNQVLFGNNLEIRPGEFIIMTGPSGSGKTTLLTLMGALRTAQVGHLSVLGQDLVGLTPAALVEVRRRIGFIFQAHNLFDSLTAYENVRLAMELVGTPPESMRSLGTTMLDRLGLGHRVDYKPGALSGGQRQRVAVARALVNRPRLILADEPTAALDREASASVIALLKELVAENGTTVVMVTHDNRVLDAADRIINMVDGRVVGDVMVEQAMDICQALRTVKVFDGLGATEMSRIAEAIEIRPFAAGDIIIRQGDIGEEFFLVAAGSVDIVIRSDGTERTVATLGKGESFGERALLTGETRSATVVGREDGSTYVIDKQHFDAAVNNFPTFRRQILEQYFSRQ